MSVSNFRSYQLSKALYLAAKPLSLPHGLRDQLMRAASSISLNLMEGSAKPSAKERRRFYTIALGSLREVQAIVDLESEICAPIADLAHDLGGMLYRLTRPS